ncbi:uncharacterized protein LOC110992058 [Pieris rapae]|uniref:uncharacterized protein LOC110992058 n=1 Tax=Pieris rapae TaxID=64459 RepID=UPI001E27B197|nr:uncharacterized protein LOC110992058 [Pieris rapae]
MEDQFVSTVLELFHKGDWKSIIKKYHSDPVRNTLSWVFPSEDNLQFINRNLAKLKCDQVLSIGCGSGLLEWILNQATGIPVRGIEVDGTWWKSKYAPATFIDFLITSPALDKETINILSNSDSTAILFCYFNDGDAFRDYLKYFSGRVLIIIGSNKHGVHTNPQPFVDVGPEWTLWDSQEVRDSQDFITIYLKNND